MRIVLQFLKDHQLYDNFSKCDFWLRSVASLVILYLSKGIEVNPMKTDVVKVWSINLTPIDIRSVLGLAGSYRRFVVDFSPIASMLTTLTHPN